jgi:SAM-dependent methyltransferase/diadenosine tetraphosphate (Ap4A) HIT family hydrolase
VTLAGAALTGSSLVQDQRRFSRLIFRTSVVDVIVGLGSISAGYLLLIPRRHVMSMGELSWPELRHAHDVARIMASRVETEFSSTVVAVEHGSSGIDAPQETLPACITHAHVHLFPIPPHADPEAFVPSGSLPLGSLAELQSAAVNRRNYYYCQTSTAASYLSTDTRLSSQYARRIWANLLGSPDEWDWALFPNFEACQETVARLKARSRWSANATTLPPDDGQAETIAAYNGAARWYAKRTGVFPRGSRLRPEIEALAQATDGWILDAGAGGCRDAAHFAAQGREVVALDASGALLAAGVEHHRMRKVAADIRSIPLADGSVGAVWCSAVLLHLDEVGIAAALRELIRVLTPGGLAQVSVKRGDGRTVLPINGSTRYRRHFFFYEMETMARLVKVAGFEVVRTWTEDEFDVSDIMQAWIKLLLRKVC